MNECRKYCLDSNILVEGWNKYYSMDLCPSYWEIIDQLGQEGIVFAPIEVKREILKIDDGLAVWVEARPHLFREIDDDVQDNLRAIMKSHPRLVDSIKQRSIADPWVIAFARSLGAVVVTKESPAGEDSRRIKIPDVCIAYGIPWIDDFRFAKEIGIRFEAQIG